MNKKIYFLSAIILAVTLFGIVAAKYNARMPAERAQDTILKIETTITTTIPSQEFETDSGVDDDKTTETSTSTTEWAPSFVTTGNRASKRFRITVYTPYSDNGRWGYATATGAKSSHLRTCAVDPSVIPLGSTINVNGLQLKAVDTGSAVKGNHIDIFFDGSEEEAASWVNNFGDYSYSVSWTR